MKQPVCAVIGVGPGNGAAIARKFADEGYSVALCARNLDRLNELADLLPNASSYTYDVSDPNAAKSVYFLAKQPQQAWSFELDLRPYGEQW